MLVSVWTPLEFERIAARWFSMPNMFYLSPVPILTVLLAVSCWRGTSRTHPGFHAPRGFGCHRYVSIGVSRY
jgi:cytochrome d ubiquinol oxidase subunit II